jgi:ubiquinone biosynthesis protein COQ4
MQKLIANKEDTEQVFHIIEALNGRSLMRNLEAFARTPEGARELGRKVFLPPILDDHDWIRKLPDGTVGRAYVDFMERESLTAQGLVDESLKMRSALQDFDDDIKWNGNRLRDTHDLFHVLSGYGRDALGEASLLAFTYSQNPGPGVIFISFMGVRTIAAEAPKEARIMDCFWEAKRNGAAAQKIFAQDIEALLHEPLDAARTRMGIRMPVAYKNALRVLIANGYTANTQLSDMVQAKAAA